MGSALRAWGTVWLALVTLLGAVVPALAQEDGRQLVPSRLSVSAQAVYVVGLPMPVELAYENGGFFAIAVDEWVGRGLAHEPFLAEWRNPETGTSLSVGTRYPKDWMRRPGGDSLMLPGYRRLELVDLSTLAGTEGLEPGRYSLRITIPRLPPDHTWEVPAIQVRAATEDEQSAVSELFPPGQAPRLASLRWPAFLNTSPRTVRADVVASFGPDVQLVMRFYLWLHRALWGPTEVADLDPAGLDGLATGVFEAEVAALRYEILTGRNDVNAPEHRRTTLGRWPGLKWRLDAADKGEGMLGANRTEVRRDLFWRRLTGPPPYVEPQ